jgi:cyanophycinase
MSPMRTYGLLSLSLAGIATAQILQPYDYSCVGRCNSKVPGNPTPGTVLMGGSTDVDEAFMWMNGLAGGGDFVILRTSGSDGYNTYVYAMGGVNSVSTLVLNNDRAASNDFVLGTVANASAIFFAGGDQALYVTEWEGSPLQAVLRERSERVPMGGTSAGCAIMGEFIYDAIDGSVTTEEALANPYNRAVTFSRNLVEVPALKNLITDTHFQERDRMGRMVGFMGRLLQDRLTSTVGVVRAAGFNERNAMLIDRSGNGRVVGQGDTFMCATTTLPEQLVVQSRTPLTFAPINCERLREGDTFSLTSFSGTGTKYSFAIKDGVVVGNQYCLLC